MKLANSKYASAKAAAFVAAKSVQVPGQLSSVLYTLVAPAQAPQISMFAIMLWLVKCELILQSVDGKSASAVPQLDGSGVASLEPMSDGMDERGKNHVRIPASRSSMA